MRQEQDTVRQIQRGRAMTGPLRGQKTLIVQHLYKTSHHGLFTMVNITPILEHLIMNAEDKNEGNQD